MTSKHINTNVYDRDAILASLEKLHLSGMLLALKQQCDRPEIATLTFETRLGMLLHEEIERRRTNRIQRLIHDSGLSNREGANIEGVIYNGQRNLDEGLIQELAQCHWLTAARVPSVLITGACGTGKTWLAKALGLRACENLLRVQYFRLLDLVDRLKLEPAKATFRNKVAKKQLLIIDDWGLAPFDDEVRSNLLNILDDRNGVSGTIITSQLPLEKWHHYIGNDYTADAIMDRIINFSYKIDLRGPSLREREQIE